MIYHNIKHFYHIFAATLDFYRYTEGGWKYMAPESSNLVIGWRFAVYSQVFKLKPYCTLPWKIHFIVCDPKLWIWQIEKVQLWIWHSWNLFGRTAINNMWRTEPYWFKKNSIMDICLKSSNLGRRFLCIFDMGQFTKFLFNAGVRCPLARLNKYYLVHLSQYQSAQS